ncbi:enolase C-terminal domain-like protein [Nonomuraea polychroma]|uniref:enolase C-terminal domain-like protein n=1 Tax=Nonomuraea polychroma TaxID=46176 RepID=UPI0013E2E347|nr:enolase C-terminal domain-like protein [Nonomuraea polychroma]
MPVHVLLGGRVRDRVACYTHVRPAGSGPAEVARACTELREAGWRALRLTLPASGETFEPRAAVRAGVETFAAAREAVGDDVDLILDVHTRLDPPEAALLCRELEPLRPLFVEDPLRCENLDAYRRLRERTAVPLAGSTTARPTPGDAFGPGPCSPASKARARSTALTPTARSAPW